MNVKYILKIFGLFFVFSFFVFALHSFVTQTSVFADAKFYYSITRSLIFDHDLLLGNEFLKFDLLKVIPPNNFIPSFYPPGVSIFWLPLFYTAFGFTHLIQLLLPHIRFSGYEKIFEFSAGLTNISLGIFSLFLIYKMLSKYFSEQISLLTVSLLFLTTNLFFYIAVEPINSHAASFFLSTLFVYYFLTRLKYRSSYFLLGIIGGFAGVVRTQDLLILVLPVSYLIFRHMRSLRLFASYGLLLFTGTVVGFIPQILLWKYFYHTFWFSPYIETGFNFLNPQILHVLFNSQNGLFVTTPVVFIAVIGLFVKLFFLFGKLKFGICNLFVNWDLKIKIYFLALLYFLLQLYLVSSWNVYTQGGSYSIRMIITTYPLLAFGSAEVVKQSIKKAGKNITLILIILFTAMNFLSIVNYLLKF